VHEYVLTPHSLYAAVSVGLETNTIIAVLNRLSKVRLPRAPQAFRLGSSCGLSRFSCTACDEGNSGKLPRKELLKAPFEVPESFEVEFEPERVSACLSDVSVGCEAIVSRFMIIFCFPSLRSSAFNPRSPALPKWKPQ
jgi:Helicase conserved C-terminal domain